MSLSVTSSFALAPGVDRRALVAEAPPNPKTSTHAMGPNNFERILHLGGGSLTEGAPSRRVQTWRLVPKFIERMGLGISQNHKVLGT